MLHLALRGVRYNVGRYIATLLAILTGVAFFTATGFVSDRVIDALEGDVDRQYGNVDAAVVVDDTGTGTTFAEELRIPLAAAERMARAPGVEAVAGELTGPTAFLASDGSTFGDGATGRLWIDDAELNPLEITKGRAPRGAGEIAVDQGLADDESLSVGDDVTVLSVSGEHPATVAGITKFGDSDSIDQSGTVSIPQAEAFDWLNSGLEEYSSLYLRGSGSQQSLVDAVTADVPKGFVAETGDEFRADKRDEVGSVGVILKQALQGFAILALFVGGFVIYNTFSVIVAQRQRELGVLAAIGATPKQIRRSLRYEGFAIGLLGSTLGVLVGIALTFLLIFALELFGVELPGSGIKIAPVTVISGILTGTLITYFSVTIPARRASRTEPIEAIRDASAETATVSRGRRITVLVLVGLGLLGLFVGSNAAAVGLGTLVLVVGVLLAGPLIALVGARLLAPIAARFGLEGRLAVDNSARNPKRTATTANALLIGVFLVTFVTVAGTSLKDFVVGEIQKIESADFVVSSNGGSIDDKLVADLQAVDGVEQVTPFRRESVTIDGEPSQISTADEGSLVDIAKLEADKGSLEDLGPGTIAVSNSADTDYRLGSSVTVTNTDGESQDLEVVAVLQFSIDEAQVGNLVDVQTFDELVGETAPTVAFIDATSGAQTDTEDAINGVVSTRPDITVVAGNQLAEIIGSVFDFLINAVNGLLLMSVVVALIGIVNTLSLSILERRRELGLLRVIGMTDRRVQRMVRLESGLISALGTVTGVVLGLAIGFGLVASIDRLSDADIGLSFPGLQLLLVLVAGVVLGLLASFLPARRSTRLEVLDAIQAT
jgi:putative ABC transport system permease protein